MNEIIIVFIQEMIKSLEGQKRYYTALAKDAEKRLEALKETLETLQQNKKDVLE